VLTFWWIGLAWLLIGLLVVRPAARGVWEEVAPDGPGDNYFKLTLGLLWVLVVWLVCAALWPITLMIRLVPWLARAGGPIDRILGVKERG
jgi:hypothetical protein